MFQLEKLRLAKDRDDQLDAQSSRYEERLVELHSVIAELTRQLESRNEAIIPEEDDDCEEDDDDDDDTEEGDREKGEDLASRTSTDILDAEAVEVYFFIIKNYS